MTAEEELKLEELIAEQKEKEREWGYDADFIEELQFKIKTLNIRMDYLSNKIKLLTEEVELENKA